MATLTGSGFVTAPPGVAAMDAELPPSSQSTLLLQKKKDMAEVQRELERKKEQFRQRMQRCQEKEVELAAKQEAIKEQVGKFDKFLHENDAKRVRANRKSVDEIRTRDAKEVERRALVVEQARQQARKDELLAELERIKMFETFLEKTCERYADYFEDIQAILKRHHALEATQEDLHMRVKASEEQTLRLRETLSELLTRTQTESLINNSRIAARQASLDESRRSMQDREAELAQRDEGVRDRIRMLGEVSMAIRNIYARAFDPGKGKRPSGSRLRDDEPGLLPVLDAIRQRVCDLQLVVRTLERNAAARAVEVDAAAVAGGGGGGTDPAGRGGGGAEAGRGEWVASASRGRRPTALGESGGASMMRLGGGTSVMSLGNARSVAKGDLPPLR